MKQTFCRRLISFVLVLATILTALPLTVFSDAVQEDGTEDLYIKSVKLVQAKTKEEAKAILKEEGYTLLDGNLNVGTGQDGVWLGYQTTTDPTEAIYDMKLMNMKGGYTLTSMEEALAAQESALTEMAVDLGYLIDEFVKAYEEGSVPAKSAYMALNFFRMTEGEDALQEQNGLGYRLVNGGLTTSQLTEMLLLCNAEIVDSIIKILTMGIQIRNESWMKELSEKGPYDADTVYSEDETELKRRAEQLLTVLQVYAQSYNAMDKAGLIPDKLDQNFEPEYNNDGTDAETRESTLTAEEADMKKLDEGRYKIYKVVFDELAKYGYGEGKTLKDFICSLADEGNAKKLYPLVSVLTDGEFAALSYGCFLEMATGAMSTVADYENYDALYESLTEETSSVYLYAGVDKALLSSDAVIGFTDTANRHMASTGEFEFYEKESPWEDTWETGIRVAKCIGVAFGTVIGVSKIAAGTSMIIVSIAGLVSTSAASSLKAGVLGSIIKYCSMSGSFTAFVIAIAVVALVVFITYLKALYEEHKNQTVDWEKYPMPAYLYDVQEVSFSQHSDDGIVTESLKRPTFVLYEAVTDVDGEVVDLNAHSEDASQWIAMYVSYDKQGDDTKPIKAEDLLVKTGSGEIPNDEYTPLTRFGEVIAYDLNQWDGKNDVNGVYLFYKQDQTVAVENGQTYYIYEVYLQSGKSESHCLAQLEAAGYTPINVNLSPSLTDGDMVFEDPIYTYLGYKLTTSPTSAIRDLRVVYGQSQGEIKLGAANYAECGSNGSVTLYATKYECAGTPLLAGGLLCVNDRADAPVGYEPVNFFAGGPAASFNVTDKGILYRTPELYIYFLPSTTFTGGTAYLGGITYIYTIENALAGPLNYPEYRSEVLSYLQKQTGETYTVNNKKTQMGVMYDYITYRAGYSNPVWISSDGQGLDKVAYYKTYNPYRAIYKVNATANGAMSNQFSFEGVGYTAWNTLYLYSPNTGNNTASGGTVSTGNIKVPLSAYIWSYNGQGSITPMEVSGKLYVAGNPDAANVYTVVQEQDASGQTQSVSKMKNVQPIRLADITLVVEGKSAGGLTSAFKPVADIFAEADEAVSIQNKKTDYAFSFYVVDDTEERPYVSGFLAVDQLSLYRAYGGDAAGISRNDVTEPMMLAQLASMGATNFFSYRGVMTQESYMPGDINKMNIQKFAYKRSAKGGEALRDIFFYFNGFSADEPPKEIYRGSTKYTLLCEIPYNLTGYNGAPKPGIYLYGTTDSKAGNRIIDIEISESPFMEGFETVRSMSGRSIWSEIADYAADQMKNHPMGWAQETYEDLWKFFTVDEILGNSGFYIHVRREGDSLSKQEPYIGELYLAYHDEYSTAIPEMLFDMGADGYVDYNLNDKSQLNNLYVGYSYTADPADAIKEIRAYHKKNPPATLTDKDGRTFTLVSDLDLNKDAGGDYIYLYATKESATAEPITSLWADSKISNKTDVQVFVDGSNVTATTSCVKKWDSTTYSDLDKGASSAYIYLMYTTVNSSFTGTHQTPDYGANKTYTRSPFSDQTVNGAYIGGLYVMDKETIRLEKIASGALAAGSTCEQVTDQEVFDRLKAMGATSIVETPILVNSTAYFKGNQNKVFIGYSRTDKSNKAIRSIAIKAEILNLSQPAEKIEANGKTHTLVAEAASKVTELPRAINLIGTQDSESTLLPRLYLYYSTSGDEPIYDICIDSDPIKNGWVTVRSASGLDPFADIYGQAYKAYELANQDDWDQYDPDIVYTDSLFEWMDDVADLFNPEDAEVTPFYIHTKTYTEATLEEIKPYIGEIFVAEGGSKHEALSNLVAFAPDGFVDADLNRGAGGNYVYMAYKRVAKARDALTDLVIYEGKNPDPTRRMTLNEHSVKFTLVSDVDLNSRAGGKYLYLYATDSSYTGSPITSLSITERVEASVKCGVERSTVKRGEGKAFTEEAIDLNKGAGGDYLYLVMNRETSEGHTMDDSFVQDVNVPATCEGDGYYGIITRCKDCHKTFESVLGINVSDGSHYDAEGDEDHKCDHCGKRNVSEHTYGDPVEEKRVDATEDKDGYYKLACYCTECGNKKSLGKVIIPAGTPGGNNEILASLFGRGSVIIVCSMAGIAIAAAAIVFIRKRNKHNHT